MEMNTSTQECGKECKHTCSKKQCIKDFLCFKHMLTPWLIQFFFWLGLAAVLLTVATDLFHGQFIQSLQVLIIGPIALRIFCELFILFFRINETLTESRNLAEEHNNMLATLVPGYTAKQTSPASNDTGTAAKD